MIRGAINGGVAVGTSLALHVGAAFALIWTTEPDPVPEQPTPETELQLSAYQVERTEAAQTRPDAESAASGDTSGARVDQDTIRTARATATRPETAQLTPSEATGSRVTASEQSADRVQAMAPTTEVQSATDAEADMLEGLTPDANTVADVTPVSEAVAGMAPQSKSADAAPLPFAPLAAAAVGTSAVAPAVLTQAPVASQRPEVQLASAVVATAVATGAIQPAAALATPAALAPDVSQTVDPQPVALPEAPPPTLSAKASLAFAPSDGGPVDPVSLAAYQSFMEPGNIQDAAAEVRDGILGALSAVPCSRLQVAFDPDANALQVIGHVPEPQLRQSVLAAMQEKMGADIPVMDQLLILPRPQCGALTGIANVGLPQSTDQITNPLLVGEDTHAREFGYVEGEALVLGLQGADYDAYIYVDYFDADGNVVHLFPNEFTPHTLTTAKSALQIGADAPLAAGESGLYIKIGPPYGQEIAVAFAASEPLYQGTRPLVEEAATYLDWLQTRVAEARATHEDFKGEWVYFFISTSAG